MSSSKRESIVHITPTIPGEVDGVTSYATLLASTLPEYKHFFVCQNLTEQASSIGDTSQLYSDKADQTFQKTDIIILHYVGYAYQKYALPLKLLFLLRKYKSKPIVTIFHELEIDRSTGLKENILGYLQLRVISQILKLSSVVLTSCRVFKERLIELDPWSHNKIYVEPIVSNIPERADCLSSKLRSNSLIVFGTPGRRKAVYDTLPSNFCGFDQIVDIGQDFIGVPSRVGTVPILKRGVLSNEQISDELQKSRFGLIDYAVDMLGKSSIFATYLSQGTIPILTRWQGKESLDGVTRGQEFLILGDSLDDLESLQFKGRLWYQSHSLSNLAGKVKEMLSFLDYKKKKALLIFPHTTQNDAPLALISKEKAYNVVVAYCSPSDHAKGAGEEWINRNELLRQCSSEIYSVFPKNISPFPKLGTFFGLINPGLINLVLKAEIVVIFGHNYLSLFVTTLLGRIAGKKVVVSTDAVSLGESKFKAKIKKLLFPIWYKFIPDRIIVPSTASESFLQSLGIPHSKISITPYASDEEFLLSQSKTKKDIRESLKIGKDSFVALSVAKMIDRKNLSLLIRAWSKMPEDNHLILVGDGPLREELERLALTQNNIHFVGLVRYPELFNYYLSSDILVHPAKHEPWGLPINEAMILGKPALSSDSVGAAKDLIIDSVTGWTFINDNLEDLINSLNKARNNIERLPVMGAEAKKLALSRSSSSNAAALVEVFKRLG